MHRRGFLAFGVSATLLGINAFAQTKRKGFLESVEYASNEADTFSPLAIPPLASSKQLGGVKTFDLTAQAGNTRFFENILTNTYGINGTFLGPTIRANVGEKVAFHVKNTLNERFTLHWHGLHVEGKNDGGPHQEMQPGESWSARFKIKQPASTAWYHPHTMDRTGWQVYKGIAGFFLINDPEVKNLPSSYGVDDIPVVLQDRLFSKRGKLIYLRSMHDKMMGMSGNIILTNGTINASFDATTKKLRLRLLNGSNSRIYQVGFDTLEKFDLIATDGGFLPAPIRMDNLVLSPGERAEIVVDMDEKKTINLVDFLGKNYLLRIVPSENLQDSAPLPKALKVPAKIPMAKSPKIREFHLQMGMGSAGINNKVMNLKRIDEQVPIDTTEIWRVYNQGRGMMMGMPHPFHIHGTSFEIISRNGKAPYVYERGLKDTVLVNRGEYVDLKVRFAHRADGANPYMYHCHNLEHEDMGMMGQFTVS